MAFGKRKLQDGIIPFLEENKHQNNGMAPDFFVYIMELPILEKKKASIIREISGRTLITAKSWLRQWKKEQVSAIDSSKDTNKQDH